jgi:PilZ domain
LELAENKQLLKHLMDSEVKPAKSSQAGPSQTRPRTPTPLPICQMRLETWKDAGPTQEKPQYETGLRRISWPDLSSPSPRPFPGPDVRAFTESVPEPFCSCKVLAFLYIGGSQGPVEGRPCHPSLKVDFRTAFGVFVKKNMLSEYTRRMQPESQERRMMRRFDMRLPAVVRLDQNDEFQTETQNVSARGVFFYLDRAVAAGTRCEVTLTFPPHITLTDAVRVRFTARVIRVESPLPSLRIGTAAMIEDYEFLRSSGSADFLSALQREMKTPN